MIKVFENGVWQLLEPIMNVEILVPFEFQGIVLSMIMKRSGIICGMERTDQWITYVAEVSKIYKFNI